MNNEYDALDAAYTAACQRVIDVSRGIVDSLPRYASIYEIKYARLEKLRIAIRDCDLAEARMPHSFGMCVA